MKLPEIENIGVQSRSEAPKIVGEAQARTLNAFASGFEALGKEMVRSQQQKAAADLAVKLNSIEQDIAANKTVKTEYVRQKLGGSLETLPPEIRSQVTTQGLNVKTGQIEEMDREDVPMFAVAGAIYDAQAKQAVDTASQNITLGGWQNDFKEKIQDHVIQRKANVTMAAVRDSLAHIQVTDTTTALDFANAGDFTNARKVISDSRAMDADYKDKVNSQIDKLEEIRPVYQALQNDDYGSMAVMLGQLNDPSKFTKLSPEERTQFTDRLKAEIRTFQESIKKEQDRLLKQNAEAGWNGIFYKVRTGAPLNYRDIPPPGMVPADEQKAMIDYIDNRNKGIEPKTDLGLYATLSQMATTNPEEFAKVPITALINRLSPTDFKHFVDLQTKPPGGPQFDDFINTDEAIEGKLPKQFQKAEVKGDADKLMQVGYIKQIVQHELANLGHRASLQERDDIIDRVIKSNTKLEKGWFSDSVKVDTSVPPKYVVALRQVSSALGYGLTPEGIKATYQDFSLYEDGLTSAWTAHPASKGRRLSPSEALGVYGYLKQNLADIDAELARVGKLTGKPELDNPLRAALAVDSYLSNPQ